MTDRPLPLIDMGPFMRRQDHRTRRMFAVLLTISLLVSVGACAYGVLAHGAPAELSGRLWFGILFYPLPILLLWVVGTAMARRRPMQPDGSLPMNPDDARNAQRVANAGTVYVAGISVVMIASQLVLVLNVFNALTSLGHSGNWLVGRAILVASGALVAYFGNAWPRYPASRRPEHKPATQRKFHRFLGWMLVIHGLLFVLAGLFLPMIPAIFAGGASVIGLSMMLCTCGAVVVLHRAMKSPLAA